MEKALREGVSRDLLYRVTCDAMTRVSCLFTAPSLSC